MSILVGRRQLSGFLFAATSAPNTAASTTASAYLLNSVRFATKKAAGSTKNGRDSIGKRLGVKILGDQKCSHGNILIRQRGLTYGVGENVGLGKDYTIYAMMDGWVQFTRDLKKKKTVVNVTAVDPRIRLGHVKVGDISGSSSSSSSSSDNNSSSSSSSSSRLTSSSSESTKKVSNAI